MAEHGIQNAHDLHRRSGGAIPVTTAYRIVGNDGRLDGRLSALLEALCEVFGVEPCDLLQREPGGKPSRKVTGAPNGRRKPTVKAGRRAP